MKPSSPPDAKLNFNVDLTCKSDNHDWLGGLRPRFFLRRDFEIELGFLDVLPTRAPFPSWSDLRRLGARAAIAKLCIWFKDLFHRPAPPKLYLCGGMFRACPTDQINAIPFVSDGRFVIYPPADGLFADLEARIHRSVPYDKDRYIYPSRLLEARPDHSVPPFIVVHYPDTGMAEILPSHEAIKRVLEANGYLPKSAAG